MGLDTTHGCWHGPYSSFASFRKLVAASMGFDLHAMVGFGGEVSWDTLPESGLHILLNHSDCDGEITVEEAVKLKESMEAHRETFKSYAGETTHRDRTYHVDDYMLNKYDTWIEGLGDAIEANETIEFH